MKPLILIACFLPLFTIWLVMKLSLWIAAVNEEQNYVRDDAKRPHGPYVKVIASKLRELEVDAGKLKKSMTLILLTGSSPVLTTKRW